MKNGAYSINEPQNTNEYYEFGFILVNDRSKGIWISEGLLYMNNKMRTKHWGPGPHKSGPMIKENSACVSVLSSVFTSGFRKSWPCIPGIRKRRKQIKMYGKTTIASRWFVKYSLNTTLLDGRLIF